MRFWNTQDLGDVLKAAMAEPGPEGYGVGPTSSQLPGGAQTGGVPPAGGVPPVAMQTPEEAEQNTHKICEIWRDMESEEAYIKATSSAFDFCFHLV